MTLEASKMMTTFAQVTEKCALSLFKETREVNHFTLDKLIF